MVDQRDRVGTAPGRKATAGIPRWVMGFAIAAAVLVAAFFAMHLSGLAPAGHSMPTGRSM